MNKSQKLGHISAFFTVLFWGTTFISTKILLTDFSPIEILFFRFVLGTLALYIAFPHKLKLTDKKHNITFILAGIFGVTLYFLLENIALTYTTASNVGVIVAVAPFFTAILAHFFVKKEKLSKNFFIGFLVSILGIFLISFNGAKMQLNPKGDVLAILAAICWAIYSILVNKINSYKYNSIQATRKIFLYGVMFMIPALFFMDFKLDFSRFADFKNLFNILYLGLGASAICFVIWGISVRLLGTLKTTVYIYMVPVIAVIFSAIILKETITPYIALGTALTLSGLLISQFKFKTKKTTT